MKFNVDGAARGCLRLAGIGGILRDCCGEVKIIFSKALRKTDSNLAKMMVVKEAFLIFFVSRWNKNHKLLIGSDSSNAVKWTKHPNSAPWRMRQLILLMTLWWSLDLFDFNRELENTHNGGLIHLAT
ncbi:Uncharacterized protein TCM_018948 [Theobroma cacao]|uniref:RNase H type-1 domain-containing protein n=1 Tax=Theobroma cacao TaxID=3641 RepID=A0A061EFJ1_THECC|nr:Uncharacterized protein TCM_018948 [Theobroma cacao]